MGNGMPRLLLVLLASITASDPWGKNEMPRSQCGINAACFAVKYFGIDCSLAEAYNGIDVTPEGEVNLEQLRKYIERFGLQVRGIRNPTASEAARCLDNGGCLVLQWAKVVNDMPLAHIFSIVDIPTKGYLAFDFPYNMTYISSEKLSAFLRDSQGMLEVGPKIRGVMNGKLAPVWLRISCVGALVLMVSWYCVRRFRKDGGEVHE